VIVVVLREEGPSIWERAAVVFFFFFFRKYCCFFLTLLEKSHFTHGMAGAQLSHPFLINRWTSSPSDCIKNVNGLCINSLLLETKKKKTNSII
jgi:hypothetical protein